MGVVWTSGHEDEVNDVYFAESIDRGVSYGINSRVHESSTGAQQEPAIAYDSLGVIHVLWEDAQAPAWDSDIHYAFSSDIGRDFSDPERVNDDPPEPPNCQDMVATAGLGTGAVAVWLDSRENMEENVFSAGPAPSSGVTEKELWSRPDGLWSGPSHAGSIQSVLPTVTRRGSWFRAPSASIFDSQGSLVRRILSSRVAADGWLYWDGRDGSGLRVAPGTYFVRMAFSSGTKTGRIILVR